MKIFYTLLFIVFSLGYCFAQNQGNKWYFGEYAGLDFNSGSPVPITTGLLFTNEGSASIADKTTGNLLFYTDGTYAWDKTNNYMPNGFGMGGNPSTTQSAVIIPIPGSNTQYYVFTADDQAGDNFDGDGGVNYNLVDMTLNGGLGDVSILDQPLLTPATEKIAASYASNDTDIWVVIHQWNTNHFYSYKITGGGISAPVISSTGIVHEDIGSGAAEEAIGYMKISPDGKRLALACYNDLNTVQIFDFDNATGIVSNPITDTNYPNISGEDGPYGVSFSPDNSKLYIGYLGIFLTASHVYQYNLLAGSAAAIIASRTSVDSTFDYGIGAIQIGPDGKMYVAKTDALTGYGADSLDVIENPNGLGTACNYITNGLYLGGAGVNESTYGLPDMIEQYLVSPCSLASLNIVPQSPTICSGTNVTLNVSGGTTYTWSPAAGLNTIAGSSVVAAPTMTTTYTVSSQLNGCAEIDTDVVTVIEGPSKPVITQTGDVLSSSATQGNQWVRNDSTLTGAINQDYTATIAGWYKVVTENPANGCSTTSDSIYVNPSGINQLTVESGQLTVYPNPTGGEIMINISSSVGEVKDWNLQMSDVLGRIVYTKSSLNYCNDVDISNLPGGVYFISVINKTGSVVVSVLKQ